MGFPQIVVGTYEEFVLGYQPKNVKDEKTNSFNLVQSFATHSHQASVRCVAAHGQLMASSGADEYINLYDMVAMEVSSVITYHDSTVTCLEFTPDGSHLVTSNQNGDIAIFKCKNWSLVKLWKGAHKHANGVTSINIHPSGSLLLTTGADNILRFWNLIKGRQAYAINFSKKCSVGNLLNFAIWSKSGNFYAVSIGNKVELYKTKTAAIVYEIQTPSKIICASFPKKNLLCIGTEEGSLEIHSITEKKLLLKEQIQKSRVKSVTSFCLPVNKNGKNKIETYIVTADSQGGIKLWFLRKKDQNYFLKLKSEVDCECRITCLTVVVPRDVKEEKSEQTHSSESNEKSNDTSSSSPNTEDTQSSFIKQKKNFPPQVKQKLGQKIIENGNSTPKSNGKCESRIKTPKNQSLESEIESGETFKAKKRKISEGEARSKQKTNLNKSSESLKQFNKRKSSDSISSPKNKRKSFTGKWSIQDCA